MGSLDGINYSAFAPHTVAGPNYLSYFQQGQNAVQSVLDAQFQAQTRQRLLDEQDERLSMERLLGPSKVAAANWQAEGYKRPTYNSAPISGGIGDSSGITSSTLPTPSGSSAPAGDATALPADSSSPTGGISNASAPDANGFHMSLATTFATPSDLADFAKNKSLATGDNGRGAWGDNTMGDTPYVALPPSTLKAYGIDPNTARGTPVTVQYGNRTVQAVVGDKMPDHSSNGAGIDMNPATASALGISDVNNFKDRVSFKIGRDATPSKSAPLASGDFPINQDGGILNRTSVGSQAANPAMANFIPTGGAGISARMGSKPISDLPFLSSSVTPVAALDAPTFAPSSGGSMGRVDLSNLASIGSSQGITARTPLATPRGITSDSLLAANVSPISTDTSLDAVDPGDQRSLNAGAASDQDDPVNGFSLQQDNPAPTPNLPRLAPVGSGQSIAGSSGIRPTIAPIPTARPVAPSTTARLLPSSPIGGSTGIGNQPYRLVTGFTDPTSKRFVQTNDPRMVPQGLAYESRSMPAASSIPVRDENGAVIGHTVNGHFVRTSTVDQRSDAKVLSDLANAGGSVSRYADSQGRLVDRVGALDALAQLNQDDDGATSARPMSYYQRENLLLSQQREARLRQKTAGESGGGHAAQLDSPTRLRADLTSMHGHDLAEFQNAGPEDTRPENGGMAFYLGGEDESSKERVFMTGPQYAQYKQRLQGLQNGQPVQLNANTQPPGTGGAVAPASSNAPAQSIADKAAAWVAANPNDPRAAEIKKRLNLQ